MVREFYEETGCFTETTDWTPFAELTYNNDKTGGEAKVYCFRMFNDIIRDCSTVTDELIEVYKLGNLYYLNLRENTRALVSLALQNEFSYTILKQ